MTYIIIMTSVNFFTYAEFDASRGVDVFFLGGIPVGSVFPADSDGRLYLRAGNRLVATSLRATEAHEAAVLAATLKLNVATGELGSVWFHFGNRDEPRTWRATWDRALKVECGLTAQQTTSASPVHVRLYCLSLIGSLTRAHYRDFDTARGRSTSAGPIWLVGDTEVLFENVWTDARIAAVQSSTWPSMTNAEFEYVTAVALGALPGVSTTGRPLVVLADGKMRTHKDSGIEVWTVDPEVVLQLQLTRV